MKFTKNVVAEGSVHAVEWMFMKYGPLMLWIILISGGAIFLGFILRIVPNTREFGTTVIMFAVWPLIISIACVIIGGSLTPRPPRDG